MTYNFVVLQLARVDAILVVDAAILLHHSDALGTSTVQVPHTVHAHITKALYTHTNQITLDCLGYNHKLRHM